MPSPPIDLFAGKLPSMIHRPLFDSRHFVDAKRQNQTWRAKPERYSSAAAALPLSPAERMIASVWSDVLGVKAAAPDESF
jgi:hypothetical protein